MPPIKTITTPVSMRQVQLKEWITGREREYIESAMYGGMSAKPRISGKDSSVDIDKMSVENLITGTKHRAIETFVVAIDDKKENLLNEVLDMHEDDTEFIMSEIDKLGKKKEKVTT